jgi:uncharacterized protein YdeI (YjbR/CyaY-like superfamily)
MEPHYFKTAEAFRDWLLVNAESAPELVVGFHKLASGTPGITWPQAVDEALCAGWVDGVRHRVDERRYEIRFTPRKPSSIWSAVNIERVRVLTREGRMMPAGLEAFARRSDKKSRIYSYEQTGTVDGTHGLIKLLKKNRRAWAFFEAQAPSYRKKALWRIVSAKQEATRDRRIDALLTACEAKVRI